MSTLLRRVKTTIHEASTQTGGDASVYSNIRDSGADSPYSVPQHPPSRRPYSPQNPFADFRRRLARQASILSLKGKIQGKQHRGGEIAKTKSEAITLPEKKLPEPPSSSVSARPIVRNKDGDHSGWDLNSSRSTVILTGDRSGNKSTNLDLFPSPPKTKQTIETHRPANAPTNPPATPHSVLQSLQETIRLKQRLLVEEGYIQRSHNQDHTFVKMAAENAAPPVPYSRLMELTISACEKALSSVSSYHHASTEEWNTTIINTILGTLVSETTPAAEKSSSPQPQFKYVVNSTIIQHAPTSSGGSADPTVTGRRGMHAASGAYWNNERDGMWSYKYSAAEKKGLDVVVGIIWIWVG